ncbi:hypothetical protein RHMOL_Rhmol12G0039700 [Rhododendron molle]|uniref:Uncharacterized protein n=1 Tax=Rhododendron molle TaxID=49168 RepID=A0ACC0LEF7_RHOML|nr:hypothetical protein RHMOL_Rhmol12G0039700 [Rhododendron molle]
MGDAGFIRFPTCLDPRAEEFRPLNQTTLFQPHQIFYPYPQEPVAVLHLTPFSDFTNTTNVAPFYAPPAHVSLPLPSAAPTRILLLSSVPTDVSDSDVRRDLEIFGDVRAVQMERLRDGIVTVHFYDVRSAQRAAAEVRGQHVRQQGRLRVYYDAVLARNSSGGEVWGPVPVAAPAGPGVVGGHAVWAQFKVPMGVGGVPDGVNQGTIVVFNLDEGVNTARLKEIFEAFGPVKELRETPMKRQPRFIEFYDVRHASRALTQMNGKEIDGKQIVIEFAKSAPSKPSVALPVSPNPTPAPFRPPRRHHHHHHHHHCRFYLKFTAVAVAVAVAVAGAVGVERVMRTSKWRVGSTKLLLKMLDSHCILCNENIADGGPFSSYDFVYLPIDFINKCNLGYGFVNMTSPEATLRLYKAFHHQNWEVFNSKKICEVTYARLQGVEALKEHFKNTKFPGGADEYLPVVFSPPRDGRQSTDPNPIVGRSSINAVQSPAAVSSSNSNSSCLESNDDNDNDDLQAVEGAEVNGGNDNNDGNHSNDGFGGDNDVGGGGGGGSNSSSSTTTSNGGDSGHDPHDS